MAGILSARLAKVAATKKKEVKINPDGSSLFAVMCARCSAHWPSPRMHLYALKGFSVLPRFYFSVCM